MGNDNQDMGQALQTLFSGLLSEQSEAFGTLRAVFTTSQTLLQMETQRLEQKLGPDDRRVAFLRQSLQTNAAAAVELQLEGQIAQLQVPTAEPGGAVLHGLVLDEARAGVAGLSVTLENQQGQVVSELGQVATDPAGQFAIRLDPATVANLEANAVGPLAVTVRDHLGNVVQRTEDLTVRANTRQALGGVMQRVRRIN